MSKRIACNETAKENCEDQHIKEMGEAIKGDAVTRESVIERAKVGIEGITIEELTILSEYTKDLERKQIDERETKRRRQLENREHILNSSYYTKYAKDIIRRAQSEERREADARKNMRHGGKTQQPDGLVVEMALGVFEYIETE